MYLKLFLFGTLLLHCCNSQEDNTIVSINDGQIKGKLVTTDTNLTYYSFTGIPYAKPPLGELRFQPPVPPIPWDEVLDTTKYKSKCVQGFFPLTMGSEDCLHLNVFTKQLASEQDNPLPVLFYIHGGGFVTGSGDGYGPDFIIEHDVVIVTLNYRLTIFGFLTTLDESAQGNAGLKDQVIALKWVQDNIGYFNGDPNRVTIAGTSAGSFSVDYHMLSPLSEGLFHQGILQSGSALDVIALQRNPLYYLHNVATALGISTENTQQLVADLQQVDAIELLLTAIDPSKVGEFSLLGAWPFIPTVETEHDGAFLSSSPYSILDNGLFHKLPYMIGIVSAEGTLGQSYVDMEILDVENFFSNITRYVPDAMNSVDDPYLVGDIVKSYFFQNSSIADSEQFIRYMTYEMFLRGIRKSIQIKHKAAPDLNGYFYIISYKGTKSTIHEGVGHAEDTRYFWNLYPQNPVETEIEKLTRKRLITLWINFITYGNPTPSEDPLLENVILPKISEDIVTALDVDENLTILFHPNQTEFEFWEQLFVEYGKPPYEIY